MIVARMSLLFVLFERGRLVSDIKLSVSVCRATQFNFNLIKAFLDNKNSYLRYHINIITSSCFQLKWFFIIWSIQLALESGVKLVLEADSLL